MSTPEEWQCKEVSRNSTEERCRWLKGSDCAVAVSSYGKWLCRNWQKEISDISGGDKSFGTTFVSKPRQVQVAAKDLEAGICIHSH